MTIRSDSRVLAVDWGEKRIGLAVTTLGTGLVVPLAIIERSAPGAGIDPVEVVANHADEEGVQHLLVGLPLNMDGSEGESARRARAFGAKLAAKIGVPVEFVDERLTSEAAEERARAGGWTPRSGKPIDDQAAAVLLEAWVADRAAREARARLDPGTEA